MAPGYQRKHCCKYPMYNYPEEKSIQENHQADPGESNRC